MQHKGIHEYSNPGPEYNIKSQKLSALRKALVEKVACSDQQTKTLSEAFQLAEKLHKDDRHKDMPYIFHLARVAVRIAYYLDVDDTTVLCAALLHDSVEDHAREIVQMSRRYTMDDILLMDDGELQSEALPVLTERFEARTTDVIAAVTNLPTSLQPDDYEDRLTGYVQKVAFATETLEGWLVKFGDWCDNGLGVIHDIGGQGGKHQHFRRKYGKVQPVLEARFAREDLQTYLSPAAKAYVQRQFNRGRERLIVSD